MIKKFSLFFIAFLFLFSFRVDAPTGNIASNRARHIGIQDAGAYYTGTRVEAALQEIGAGTTLDNRYLNLDSETTDVTNGTFNLTTTGQIQANTLTDGTLIITGGDLTTTGTATFGNITTRTDMVVINGTFDSDSDWDLDSGQWVIAGGKATTSTDGAVLQPEVALTTTIGRQYRVSFQTVPTSDDTIRVTWGGLDETDSHPGSNSYSFTATSASNLKFTYGAVSGDPVTVDFVTVQEWYPVSFGNVSAFSVIGTKAQFDGGIGVGTSPDPGRYALNLVPILTEDGSAGIKSQITYDPAADGGTCNAVLATVTSWGTKDIDIMTGEFIDITHSAGTLNEAFGLKAKITAAYTGASTATITDAYGVHVSAQLLGAATIDNFTGIYIPNASNFGGTFTNQTGIFVEDLTAAGTNWGIVIDSDDIGLTLGAAQDVTLSGSSSGFNLNTADLTTTGTGRFDDGVFIGTAPTSANAISIDKTFTADGSIGIQNTIEFAPSGAGMSVVGFKNSVASSGVENISTLDGIRGGIIHFGAGVLTHAFGLRGNVDATMGGDITNAYSIHATYAATGATIVNAFGIYVRNGVAFLGGSITNQTGILIEDLIAGDTNIGIMIAGNNVGINFFDTDIGIYSQADTFLDLFADGAVRIGNSSAGAPTNYTNFAPDGLQTMIGTARIIKHLHFVPELGRGQSAPTIRYDEDPYVSYTYNIGDDSHMTREVPQDMDYTVASIVKIHWYTTDATADGVDEVRWEVQWASRAVGEDITLGDTTGNSGDIVCSAVNIVIETTTVTIPADSIAAGDMLGIHVQRVALGDGTDPSASSIHVLDVELEYTSNKLGEAT